MILIAINSKGRVHHAYFGGIFFCKMSLIVEGIDSGPNNNSSLFYFWTMHMPLSCYNGEVHTVSISQHLHEPWNQVTEFMSQKPYTTQSLTLLSLCQCTIYTDSQPAYVNSFPWNKIPIQSTITCRELWSKLNCNFPTHSNAWHSEWHWFLFCGGPDVIILIPVEDHLIWDGCKQTSSY